MPPLLKSLWDECETAHRPFSHRAFVHLLGCFVHHRTDDGPDRTHVSSGEAVSPAWEMLASVQIGTHFRKVFRHLRVGGTRFSGVEPGSAGGDSVSEMLFVPDETEPRLHRGRNRSPVRWRQRDEDRARGVQTLPAPPSSIAEAILEWAIQSATGGKSSSSNVTT